MEKEGLPPETVRLIRSHIESVGQLEILLLLHASPEVSFTPAQINDRLQSNLTWVEQRLASLAAHGLAVLESSLPAKYRYAPESEEMARAVSRLADIYLSYRVRVIDTIYSPRDQMQSFSDAFRLKKETDQDG